MDTQQIFVIAPHEERPAQESALAHRWDDLPDANDRIRALAPTAAARAYDRILGYDSPHRYYRLNEARFDQLREIKGTYRDATIPTWLRSLPVGRDEAIIVCWSGSESITMTWDYFCNHWDRFCRAGPDDLIIFPVQLRWGLYFCHELEFEFGILKSPPAEQHNQA